jgi:hypothetical protein
VINFEKQRLEQWENELALRQEKVDKTKKSHDNKKASSKKPMQPTPTNRSSIQSLSSNVKKKNRNRSRTSGGLNLTSNKK